MINGKLLIAMMATLTTAAAACTINSTTLPATDGGPGADGGADTGTDTGTTPPDGGADTSTTPDASPPGAGNLVFAYVDVPNPGGVELKHLFAVPLGTTTPPTPRRLTNTTGNNSDYDPAWSLDGTKVVFTRGFPDNAGEIKSLRVVNADGTGDAELATCGFTCRSPFFGADGKIWYTERLTAVASDLAKIRNVAKAGGTGSDWAPGDFSGCVIEDFALSSDGATMVVYVDNAANQATCTAAKQGVYVVPIGATALPTPVTPTDPAVDPASITVVRLNKAKDRIYFVARAPGVPDESVFSAKVDGTDVKKEYSGATDYALTVDGTALLTLVLNNRDGSILSSPIAGGTAKPVVSTLTRLSFPAAGP